MALRRREPAPPYEVMKQVHRDPPAQERPGSMDRGTGRQSLMQRAAHPLVLRVPQGYAVVVAAAVVGLLILAYQVGYSRGQSAAAARVQAGGVSPSTLELIGLPLPEASNAARAGSPADAPSAGRLIEGVDPRFADQREPGLNYLVLALYPLDEAQRLAGFLAQHGVEVGIVPGNNEWLHVVDMQGFTASELRGPAYRQRVQQIRQLGRLWRQQHRGPTDLSDLWPQKYQGAAAASER